jgi:hypothetical protein
VQEIKFGNIVVNWEKTQMRADKSIQFDRVKMVIRQITRSFSILCSLLRGDSIFVDEETSFSLKTYLKILIILN